MFASNMIHIPLRRVISLSSKRIPVSLRRDYTKNIWNKNLKIMNNYYFNNNKMNNMVLINSNVNMYDNSHNNKFFSSASKGVSNNDGDDSDNSGKVLVEVNKRNLVRAMSGSVVLQLVYWYSVGAFDNMFERLGLLGPTLSDPLFGILDPYIGGIGATLTVANLFLARIFTNKIIGKVVVHPSGKLCSLYMYTMPFARLEERIVNIRDIVDYNITDNYYTLKVEGDRTFLMIDRSKASYGDENYHHERLLRHVIAGNPIIKSAATKQQNTSSNKPSMKNNHVKKQTKIVVNNNTTTMETKKKDENGSPIIKTTGKRKRKKRRR